MEREKQRDNRVNRRVHITGNTRISQFLEDETATMGNEQR